MPYFYSTPDDERAMLEAIGAASIDDLFASIPAHLRLDRPLAIPAAMSELELTQHMARLAEANRPAGQLVSFLGGGSYDHFIPAVVDEIASRGEFYTSYTPYQAEVSQGNLQVTFEYQTLIARLTGMDVSNASLYDGGSATAEAVLMATSTGSRRRKVVLAASVHPEYRQTIATYLENLDLEVVTVPTPLGVVRPADLAAAVDDQTACVVVQHPNFFGCVEEAEALARVAHDAGATVVAVFDPISLGLVKRPGDWGADIAVAEGQSLGSPMSYGGPYLGVLACRDRLLRRLPGRIAGQTVDRRGKRCFVLTLQTREQHIRRGKATSNVCTNQGLLALRATVYLTMMGPQGLREAANLCLQKSHYAIDKLTAGGRFERAFDAPTFKEFVLRDRDDRVDDLLAETLEAGILAGVPLGRWYPELDDCLLVAVTEKRTRQEIDSLARVLSGNEHPKVESIICAKS